ncbi:MFS transporter [Roseospira visakhapatnamensis]|uniref:PPP family 3-phenylpropionic acid transporter n=1 Tax=Roseospira visakhapatnamensis TaxID=390880 RepID=A0A7W6WA61_9PROT|nr:PPP family 3-phenylpropionic acid transporter [Roseospira visakhapatnamensis]
MAILFAAQFTAVGVLLPFWPAWLEGRGLLAVEIGVIMAASQWAKVLVHPVVGSWVDRHHQRRRAIVALAVGSWLGFAALMPLSGFWPLLVLSLPASACMAAMMPLSETVALSVTRTRGADYGRMRLWGSLTFILAAVGAGVALERWPLAVVFPAMLLAALGATVWAASRLPGDDDPPAQAGRRARGPGQGLGRLLGEPRFLLFLGCAGLAQASHAPYYGFSTLHWRAAGLSDTTIGLLWAIGVLVEIGLFAVGARMLARLGAVGLLMSAGLGGVLRWTVLALTVHPAALFAVQGLHGLTFAAAHLGAMHFIAQAVPSGYAVRAQGLYSALSMGAFLGVAMLASGWLYARVEGLAFLLATGLCVASVGLAGVLAVRWRGGPLWDADAPGDAAPARP